jgi:hypothetical protein
MAKDKLAQDLLSGKVKLFTEAADQRVGQTVNEAMSDFADKCIRIKDAIEKVNSLINSVKDDEQKASLKKRWDDVLNRAIQGTKNWS